MTNAEVNAFFDEMMAEVTSTEKEMSDKTEIPNLLSNISVTSNLSDSFNQSEECTNNKIGKEISNAPVADENLYCSLPTVHKAKVGSSTQNDLMDYPKIAAFILSLDAESAKQLFHNIKEIDIAKFKKTDVDSGRLFKAVFKNILL